MSATDTAPDALNALAQELTEVEWLGRNAKRPAVSARFATLDLLLVVWGALLGAALYFMARG